MSYCPKIIKIVGGNLGSPPYLKKQTLVCSPLTSQLPQLPPTVGLVNGYGVALTMGVLLKIKPNGLAP